MKKVDYIEKRIEELELLSNSENAETFDQVEIGIRIDELKKAQENSKIDIEKIMKLVESRLLFPYEGTLVSGEDKTREWVLGHQRTDFNKLKNELLKNLRDNMGHLRDISLEIQEEI